MPNLDAETTANRGPADRALGGLKSSSKDYRPVPSRQRSRASNSPAALISGDQRSAHARRFKDVAGALIADAGGAENCSEARLQLVRRLAGVAVAAESMEAALAAGEAVDLGLYATMCSTATRIAARLGLSRRARKIETLDDIIEEMTSDAQVQS